MPRRAIPTRDWELFFALLAQGYSKARAADEAGISRTSAYRVFNDPSRSTGHSVYRAFSANVPAEISFKPGQLPGRALEDFGLFRRRYFGRLPTPWQVDAALRMKELLDKARAEHGREYVVVNCPPGSGKSTLFTHDLLAWLLCQDRSLRCLVGSRTQPQAEAYVARLRRSFERPDPPLMPQRLLEMGLAVHAKGTLAADYGRFKPERAENEIWRRDKFTIISPGIKTDDKEASVTAYGLDSGFLGGRFDLVIWDDAVDAKNIRNPDTAEDLDQRMHDEIEPRLDPGGLFIFQGQRLGARDQYRRCLDRVSADGSKMYSHIIFPAHDELICKGEDSPDHAIDGPFAPNGCLLDPIRLPWRRLKDIRDQKNNTFRVVYQQEDVDPDRVLVPKLFIDGGLDKRTKVEHPGCWDEDRYLGQLPSGLSSRCFSVITADPSPTKLWGVMWWLYDPDSQFAHLIQFFNEPMGAPELLDFKLTSGLYTGLLEEWWQHSKFIGRPVTHVIVEYNAAQRFLLQYDYARTWKQLRGVNIVGHQTQMYKSDPELGVPAIRPHFEFGRVRLPGGDKVAIRNYINELTHYPDWPTTDTVMATWFLYWNAPNLLRPRNLNPPRMHRPSWMNGRTRRVPV